MQTTAHWLCDHITVWQNHCKIYQTFESLLRPDQYECGNSERAYVYIILMILWSCRELTRMLTDTNDVTVKLSIN